MVLYVAACIALLCIYTLADQLNPLSDEFINQINKKQNLWKAGKNFDESISMQYIRNLLGARKDDFVTDLEEMVHDKELIASLPENFDPRDKWPNCPSLNEIRDQGACGSCWAVAAAETMTDRFCIYSNGSKNFHFSAEDLLSCCSKCGSCKDGNHGLAWLYWKDNGIVSGGAYNSNQGCRPYEIAPCEHIIPGKGNRPPCGEESRTPECYTTCKSNYEVPYKDDKRYGKQVYSVSGEDNIKAELFKNGPVEGVFMVYTDFFAYKSGIYKHIEGKQEYRHAVKIMGWGVENGTKYWLIANSWNPDWGQNGFFKMLRGEDHCEIESSIVAGEPLFD